MYFRLALLFLSVCLGGCVAPPAGELERPEPPVPKAWAELPVDGAQAAKVHWRSFFPDPRLQALITLALENNRDLRIAAARVEEARAQYGVTKADRFPSIGLTGSGAFVGMPSSSTQTNSERYDLGASVLSYELDFWGRLRGLSETARYSYLATEEAQRWVQVSLVGDVASAYFAYLQARDSSELARYALDLREQSLVLIGKGRDIGGAQDLDYQNAVHLVESARSSNDSAMHQQRLAANRLNFLIGNSQALQIEGGSIDDQGLDAHLAPGIPAEVLLLRPDVAAAEQRLRAAHANIEAARAAFLPKVLLTASAGLASQGLSSLFNGMAWTFQPSITLPLFDGGRLASGLELAEARKVLAVAEYEKTLQVAFREVADLLSTRQMLSSQLNAALASRRAQGKLLEIANARYRVGLTSYLDILEAQRAFLASSNGVLEIRRAQLDASSQLYKALGGGGAA